MPAASVIFLFIFRHPFAYYVWFYYNIEDAKKRSKQDGEKKNLSVICVAFCERLPLPVVWTLHFFG